MEATLGGAVPRGQSCNGLFRTYGCQGYCWQLPTARPSPDRNQMSSTYKVGIVFEELAWAPMTPSRERSRGGLFGGRAA